MTESLHVYIPTMGRVGKQYTLDCVSESWKPYVFLVCPASEANQHDWPNIITTPEEVVGNIGKIRQWIIENSPSKYVGQMDDDLSFYKRDEKVLTKNHRLSNCDELLDTMDMKVLLSPANMVKYNKGGSLFEVNKPETVKRMH